MPRGDRAFYAPYLKRSFKDVPGSAICFEPFFDGIGFGGKPCRPGFNLQVTPELAEQLRTEGWKVSSWKKDPDDPNEETTYFLKLNFSQIRQREDGSMYPEVYEVVNDGYPISITEETIVTLQNIRKSAIEHFDVTFHGYAYDEGHAMNQTAYVDDFIIFVKSVGIRERYADLFNRNGVPDEEPPFEP